MKILYIEDDRIARENLTFFLKQLNAEITDVEDALTALELLKKENFDLIITDIKMPRMSGVEFVKELRLLFGNSYSHVPVIVTTAFKEQNYLVDLLEELVLGVIFKPVDFSKLEELIKRVECKEST